MNKTPKEIWDEAEEGQAFLTGWKEDTDDDAFVVWIKGRSGGQGVECSLEWSHLTFIAPITIGDRVYTSEES